MNNNLIKIKQRFEIVGNSKILNRAIEIAMQVAPTDLSVLINGENGSGKESFSKIIHSLSKYKHGKFIAINCGAIPEGTIDSELFGHEKGSFTGALEVRKGYFEEVDGGTIFLDEIAQMPLTTQSRLLRILEQREFIRVGSSKVMKTNVRVIAATNIDLIQQIKKHKFREDLYYRLNTVPIFVPPLRERGDDIYLLFRKFASDFSEKYNIEPIKLTEEAKILLLEYRFPGNIRQLKNITNQISILEKNRLIDLNVFKKYLPDEKGNKLPTIYNQYARNDQPLEKEVLYKALFEMKQELNNLKKLVFDIINLNQSDEKNISYPNDIIQNENNLINKNNGNIRLIESDNKYQPNIVKTNKIQDFNPLNEDLSIENKEKELIIKALKKHNHKRKKAAHELGISERTLYRKIKQYDLDN